MDIALLENRFTPDLQWYTLPAEEVAIYRQIARDYTGKWVGYERYMKAGLLRTQEGETGILLVRFERNTGLENLGLHRHPLSDRQIVVLEGCGRFHYATTGDSVQVSQGMYLQFPRETIHTFSTEVEEMTVLSIHRPYIALGDEQCLEIDIK